MTSFYESYYNGLMTDWGLSPLPFFLFVESGSLDYSLTFCGVCDRCDSKKTKLQ